MINGGYYIKARCIQDSDISIAPPHVREIWDYLLKEANHDLKRVSGRDIQRGQCVRSYKNIQDSLHWMIGWRKKTYSKSDCETAMKWLKKHDMLTTEKTTRGMIITVCNYNYYQDPKNYETDTYTRKKHTRKPQTTDTINKNDKELKKKYIDDVVYFEKSKDIDEAFKDYLRLRIENKFTMTERAINSIVKKLRKYSGGEKNIALEIIENAIVGKWQTLYSKKD